MNSKWESYENFVEEMKGLVSPLRELQLQVAQSCAPMVQQIIHTRCQDCQFIECTLDSLLDCACVPEGLELFRTLCRYYYGFNPSAAGDYVNAYREMWDQEAVPQMEEVGNG
jgi:hypothetical protein